MTVKDELAKHCMPIGTCHADFGIKSPGIMNLKKTPDFLTYSIVGNYESSNPGIPWAKILLKLLADVALNYSFDKIFSSRCGDKIIDNDLIVPVESQRGYILSSKEFSGTGHSFPAANTETTSREIQNMVANLLLSDNAAMFSKGFPAPSGQPDNSCALPYQRTERPDNEKKYSQVELAIADSSFIHITSPAAGIIISQKSKATIHLSFEHSKNIVPVGSLFILEHLGWFSLDGSNTDITISLPDDVRAGKLNVLLMTKDKTGALLGDTTSLFIKPDGNLKRFEVEPTIIELDSALRESNLHIHGFFSDNDSVQDVDISSPALGTTYSVKNGKKICQVSPNGIVTAVNAGKDTIIVENQGMLKKVPVVVNRNFKDRVLGNNVIEFAQVPDQIVGAAPFAMDATASSGEDVNFSLISGPAIVKNGIVKVTGEGTVTIKATSSGNPYFVSAIPVIIAFNVNKVSQDSIISFSSSLTNHDIYTDGKSRMKQNRSYYNPETSTGDAHFHHLNEIYTKANISKPANDNYIDSSPEHLNSPRLSRLKTNK